MKTVDLKELELSKKVKLGSFSIHNIISPGQTTWGPAYRSKLKEEKTVAPGKEQVVVPSDVAHELSKVTVQAAILSALSVNKNGNYVPEAGTYGFNPVNVDVDPIEILDKSASIITTSIGYLNDESLNDFPNLKQLNLTFNGVVENIENALWYDPSVVISLKVPDAFVTDYKKLYPNWTVCGMTKKECYWYVVPFDSNSSKTLNAQMLGNVPFTKGEEYCNYGGIEIPDYFTDVSEDLLDNVPNWINGLKFDGNISSFKKKTLDSIFPIFTSDSCTIINFVFNGSQLFNRFFLKTKLQHISVLNITDNINFLGLGNPWDPNSWTGLDKIKTIWAPLVQKISYNCCIYKNNSILGIFLDSAESLGNYNGDGSNDGNCAFSLNPNLRQIKIPKVKIIANAIYYSNEIDGCFAGDCSLKTVYVPELEFLGTAAFGGCIKLERFYAPKLKRFGQGGYNLGSFYNCFNLSNITIGNSPVIQPMCFVSCRQLKEISFNSPSEMRFESAKYMFSDCRKLTKVNLYNQIIGGNSAASGMFQDCTSLNSVSLENAILNGNFAAQSMFQDCTSLNSVSLENATLNGNSAAQSMFYNCTSLNSVSLENATLNGNSAAQSMFYNCTSLNSIVLPLATFNEQESAYQMFYKCSSLENVCIPVAIFKSNYASDSMFLECKNLKKIELLVAERIGTNMFNQCQSLNSVIIKTGMVPALDSTGAFENTPIKNSTSTGFIYVPDTLVSQYQVATNWATFSSKIKPLSSYVGE